MNGELSTGKLSTRADSARIGGRGWFAAVMLFVLLAAAGIPGGAAELASRQRVEAAGEVVSPRAARVAIADAPVVERIGSAPALQLPRAVPRARSVNARGLPPPRAPTA